MIVLKDQPLMRQGVLPYKKEDGTIIRKAKLWRHFKNNIGRRVGVIDEHPNRYNGYGGLYAGQKKKWGTATIKRAGDHKMLVFDAELEDGAPVKTGYSAGYPYIMIVKPGKIAGDDYDMIQGDIVIDHIALTDVPREPSDVNLVPPVNRYCGGGLAWICRKASRIIRQPVPGLSGGLVWSPPEYDMVVGRVLARRHNVPDREQIILGIYGKRGGQCRRLQSNGPYGCLAP